MNFHDMREEREKTGQVFRVLPLCLEQLKPYSLIVPEAFSVQEKMLSVNVSSVLTQKRRNLHDVDS